MIKIPSIIIGTLDVNYEYANKIKEYLAGQGCKCTIINEFSEEPSHKKFNECPYFIIIWTKDCEKSQQFLVYNAILASNNNCKPIILNYDYASVNPALQFPIISFNDSTSFYEQLKTNIGLESPEVKGRIAKNKLECIKDYHLKTKQSFGLLKVLGSGNNRPIEEIYLPIFLSQTSTKQSPIPAENLFEFDHKSFVILGNPGTGKTTLLKYLAFKSVDYSNYTIPIYIRINDLLKTDLSIFGYINQIILGQVGNSCAEIIRNDDEFCGLNTLLLLDGLDENSVNDLDDFYKRLNEFRLGYIDCKIIVSTRFNGYDNKRFKNYKEFSIDLLKKFHIEKYIINTCDKEKQKQILTIINTDSRLAELAKVPFLLAMICALPDPIGNKATQRAILYKQCTKFLLRTKDWEEDRPSVSDDVAEILENALKIIALRFFKLDRKGTFEEEEITFSIRNIKSNNQNLLPKEILDKICINSGLLQRTGTNFEFIHRSIWEYYVALGMLELEDSYQELFERTAISAWEEPIRLYVGLAPERILQDILTGIWKRNKGLTLRCMTELNNFPNDILNELLSELPKNERIGVILRLNEDAQNIASANDKKRLIVDTLSAFLRIEKDCEVIYNALLILEKFIFDFQEQIDCSDCEELITNKLDLRNSTKRREKYLNDISYYLSFTCIPDSYFLMGTNSLDRTISERPEHSVKLNSYCIGKYPVTNKLYYDSFPFAFDKRDAYSDRDNQPAVYISWYEAFIFARWLGCDLPTEAEWENACRASGNDDFIMMNKNKIPEYTWFANNIPTKSAQDVGQKKPNSYGLYDMLGNVREWCKDWYSKTYYEECFLKGDILNPLGPEKGESKVIKGGCWDWNIDNLLPTYRNSNTPDNQYFVNGFRLVFRDKIVNKTSYIQ